MSTAGPLNERPKKELADLARRRGIRGWESMDKAALVKALARVSGTVKAVGKPKPPAKVPAKTKPVKPAPRVAIKPAAKLTVKPVSKTTPKPAATTTSKSAAKVTRPTQPPRLGRTAPAARPTANGTHRTAATIGPKLSPKPAATSRPAAGPKGESPKPAAAREPVAPKPSLPAGKDRIYVAVPDPHWLHVMWDLSAQSVQRAEAALKQDWYGAKLVIRLSDVTSQDTTSTSETPIRDIVVEDDCHAWYVHVPQPPRQYRADIGYLSRRGEFFPIARSNVATPPKAGSAEALDVAWKAGDTKQYERTLARTSGFESPGNPDLREFFEERLKRSLGPPKEIGFGTGATPPGSLKKFFFDIDAKLIVFGRTDPSAHLTLGNDPIRLNPDGTFVMEFSLPDSRQIIPAVATSADGVEERTIVLAVERNTKYLDPMIHDQMNEV